MYVYVASVPQGAEAIIVKLSVRSEHGANLR